jgi:chemotaxis signal transduction protein
MKKDLAARPLVTFWLGATEYAFDAFDVTEMTAGASVTPIPRTSGGVAGVTAWRGQTIPVVNLRSVLKVEGRAPDEKMRLLVLGRPGPFGVLVDRGGQVLRPGNCGEVELDEDHPGGTGLLGIVRTQRGFLRVLDAAAVLAAGGEIFASKPAAKGLVP